ncbi:Protein HGH1 homolog [Eumeta japonica]|uniref:Protein HGH1 homolog n=1 Tax=Eumeta variegata TaxID=151549 RepID=A0A4C1VJD6_EUMVA|nr:Protein HGH1 homolog [Eumeta japonica]
MLSNLSRSKTIQKWLIEEHPHVPLIKLLPFCNYQESSVRRGGVVGTLRNLSFSTEFHEFLLRPDMDLLTYILNPLMGNEDYPDEEMDLLPIALQYLPQEKVRESDVDIRKMLLEILNRFCTKRNGRETLRNCGVYYVLREYHKWEKDSRVLLACENVVDILIRKEDEIGVEDLSAVEVTEDMKEKFERMDEQFVNDS